MQRLLLITAAAFALLASSAQAHVLPSGAQRRAVVIALTYWQAHEPALMQDGRPLCGEPQITWAPLAQSEGGETVGCQITMSSTAFALPAQAPLVCEVILHEIGHTLGLAHSTNPYSPMFWLIWRIAPPCQGFSIEPTRHRPGISTGDG